MELVDYYFAHAVSLAAAEPPSKTEQIDFRRAVSAAYYAIFHLFTITAAEHWVIEKERPRFARLYDHGKMKSASVSLPARVKERLGANPTADDQKTGDTLAAISKEFVALQQDRHTADYDNSKVWSYTEVENVIIRARNLYLSWNTIRTTPLAETYLLDLLGGK